MTPYTYATLQAQLLANTVKAQPPYTTAPPDFAQEYPRSIAYAEQRIITDIPLLANRQQNTSLLTTGGSRTLSLASMVNNAGGPIIVPEGMALVVAGTRVPFDMASLDVIDIVWPVESLTVTPSIVDLASPRYWALRDANTIVYCPTADGAYTAEITGLFQPLTMSVTNTTTYLGNTYPALLEAACMVFLAGALLKNFGSQSDNPAQTMSWEHLYQQLMATAKAEELRRRGLAPERPSQPQPGAA